jgi:CMP-N-acetylneuraminic acid synthetase
MYPAAPNTDYNKIIYAYNTLRKDKNKNKFIFPVVPKSNLKDHSLPSAIVKKNNRNKVNEYFFDAGQFYFAKTKVWIISKKIIKNGSKVIKLKKNESIDINTYQNFLEAKKIFKQVNKFS